MPMSQTLRSIFTAALQAVDPRAAVLAHLDAIDPGCGRLVVVGAGKASAPMARAVEERWGERITRGVVVVKYGHGDILNRIRLLESGHPVPDAAGVAGAQAIIAEVQGLDAQDLVLVCLSGGASALLPAPAAGLSLADKQAVTRLLLASGADIRIVNGVRKHLSRLKGGRLARLAAPARIATLAVSDVAGDDWATIGSGPTVPDDTTLSDAVAACRRLAIWDRLPAAARAILMDPTQETPKAGDPCFARNQQVLVASNRQAMVAAGERARALGFRTVLMDEPLVGEAKVAAIAFVAQASALAQRGERICLIGGGETTVTLGDHPGLGGRNQEFALAAACQLELTAATVANHIHILAAGTDGSDGPTDAAGGFADVGLPGRARARGRDPLRDLAGHDAHPCLAAADALLITGPTRTNVCDLAIALIGDPAA